MFSLIIIAISIVLVVLIAVATLWYGGSQFNNGQVQAKAAQVVNESAQIQGAVEAFKLDNGENLPSSMSDLITYGYLNAAPSASWSFATDSVQSMILNQPACLRADTMLGFNFSVVPGCSLFPNSTICCDPAS
jgi:competence protein ComGC